MIENFKLKVFRVVADLLNYRRAAEELHLTQPAVSAQIRSLEDKLGIALFDRIGRDVRKIEQSPVIEAVHRNAVQQHQIRIGIAAANEQIRNRSARPVLCEDHAGQSFQHVQRLRFIALAKIGAGDNAHLRPLLAGNGIDRRRRHCHRFALRRADNDEIRWRYCLPHRRIPEAEGTGV